MKRFFAILLCLVMVCALVACNNSTPNNGNNDNNCTREAADKFIREKMPKESYFQKKILDWIKDNAPNAIAWKEAAGPYSRQGIPDITCIINGRYYGFEVKRPFIVVLSKMQEQTIKQIRKADPQGRR